jgi:hypothetical protein
MLGGVKKIIIIATTKNDEAIVAKKRSSITLEDFRTIHAEVVYQLALVEELLKTTIRLENQSSNVGLLNDSEGSVYEMNDIAHVQVQSETFL